MILSKRCPTCHKKKPREEFYVDRKRSDALHTYCKSCCKARAKAIYATADKTIRAQVHREWVRKNRAHVRAYKTAHALGVSTDAVKEILARGACGICGKVDASCVDHGHETRQLRGLLCHHCNKGLGFFRDNPMLLIAAAKYLKPDIFEATYEFVE